MEMGTQHAPMPWGGREAVTLRQLLLERPEEEACVCQLHSYICALIMFASCPLIQRPSLSFRAHWSQKSGLTSCPGWRAMARMLLEEHKLVDCERSQLRNDTCLVSLGISGNHGNFLTAGPIKSSTTTRMDVFQTLVPLCHQDPELGYGVQSGWHAPASYTRCARVGRNPLPLMRLYSNFLRENISSWREPRML